MGGAGLSELPLDVTLTFMEILSAANEHNARGGMTSHEVWVAFSTTPSAS